MRKGERRRDGKGLSFLASPLVGYNRRVGNVCNIFLLINSEPFGNNFGNFRLTVDQWRWKCFDALAVLMKCDGQTTDGRICHISIVLCSSGFRGGRAGSPPPLGDGPTLSLYS